MAVDDVTPVTAGGPTISILPLAVLESTVPSLALRVKVAALLPLTLLAPVYLMLLTVSSHALRLATVPARVNVPVPVPLTVTLPLVLAAKVPAEAVRVTVRGLPSSSAKVTAARSKLLGVSLMTLTSVGVLVTLGATNCNAT